MKRILIVEDEFFLLESMVKFMNGLDNVRTRGCANLRDAYAFIEDRTPDLIFSDINLPDGSGLELINFLNSRDIRIPLVFVSAFISDYRNHIPPDSNIMVLEKPVSMKRLRSIAKEKLEEDDGDYVFKLTDYLQIAAMGGHTVQLKCGENGFITMVDGEPWSARYEGEEGVMAFKRMVGDAEVHGLGLRLSCKKIDEAEIGPQNITGSLENLMLNAVWEEEEQLRNGDGLEEEEPVPNTGALMDKGVDKLLSKEYAEALKCFVRVSQLQPDNGTALANIKRLNEMGFYLDKEAS